ncbi:peptidylprolyl isomerase [Ketobacter sp.]|uniref:FKBP-type peptidyl-prolyl cis-trans isomerase n=1 Tax=Ketobacter sp. TaxID=2083498 RepID=UPI000F224DE9|nr:peptidylprolyl isomerase [Ketobacter sp.]RLU00361.1 MAG: peptidylprolyl isomerase [Ketobacter sp.]
MSITNDTVVQFHYTLSEAGNELESTQGGEPMAYLHGHQNIIPGLEKAMAGKQEGDSFSVTIEPAEAYGERKDGATQRIPLKHMQGAKKWRPGMTAWVQTEQGQRQVTVVKVGKFNADCDLNHPLAGKTLTFDVQIVGLRPATEDEKAHGHAHGVGGHHH